jgi:hypothetical protein
LHWSQISAKHTPAHEFSRDHLQPDSRPNIFLRNDRLHFMTATAETTVSIIKKAAKIHVAQRCDRMIWMDRRSR